MTRKKTTGILLFIAALFSIPAFGQKNENRFEAKMGYGYYQGFNAGLNYFYTEKLKVGLGIGSHLDLPPLENQKHINIYLENTLHFGRLSIQDVGVWYFNQQIMYWEQGHLYNRWKIMSLGLNIGRTISITNKLGIDMEFGPAYNMVVDIDRSPSDEKTGWMWPILYNWRLQLSYKI